MTKEKSYRAHKAQQFPQYAIFKKKIVIAYPCKILYYDITPDKPQKKLQQKKSFKTPTKPSHLRRPLSLSTVALLRQIEIAAPSQCDMEETHDNDTLPNNNPSTVQVHINSTNYYYDFELTVQN